MKDPLSFKNNPTTGTSPSLGDELSVVQKLVKKACARFSDIMRPIKEILRTLFLGCETSM